MLDELAYALEAEHDAEFHRRYNRSATSFVVLKYLKNNESLALVETHLLRQFLTFVYLSETQ